MSAVSPYGGYGAGRGFALVVVLFILLIIIGASFTHHGYGGYC
ncbi:sporulation protein YjcZ [Domibacillus antri]|uniref:Sporulation protein YjcZ n=1 Tax=Domibacillus antri TaxID=1714264 RepID=A0A1Q8Q458_9BACI|nr:YjcZ family sporulation protein [Domibacillus antri]OLN22134.1 sporulation protein YjcZ [Domibacillus antri]